MEAIEFDLSEVEDLPPLEIPPAGTYTLKLSLQLKEFGEKLKLMFNYEVVAPIALKNPEGPQPIAGTKFTEFANYNKEGLAYVKDKMMVLSAAFGTTKVTELIGSVKDLTVTAEIGKKSSVKDGVTYENATVKKLAIA